MVVEDPADFVAISREQLGWLVGATSPTPLVACPDRVGDVDEVVVATLASRGILELSATGELRPAGPEAAVLAVALAADDAVVLSSYGPDAIIDLAFYADGAHLIAHQHDDEMHGFVPVPRDWAIRAVGAATGLELPETPEPAPHSQTITISSSAWIDVQRAPDGAAAAALLPSAEGLARAVFDATRVHAVERLHRTGDDAPATTLITLYEGDWGADVWVVDGAAGAAELRARLLSRDAAGSLLAEVLP